jgi:hypothetical protein
MYFAYSERFSLIVFHNLANNNFERLYSGLQLFTVSFAVFSRNDLC